MLLGFISRNYFFSPWTVGVVCISVCPLAYFILLGLTGVLSWLLLYSTAWFVNTEASLDFSPTLNPLCMQEAFAWSWVAASHPLPTTSASAPHLHPATKNAAYFFTSGLVPSAAVLEGLSLLSRQQRMARNKACFLPGADYCWDEEAKLRQCLSFAAKVLLLTSKHRRVFLGSWDSSTLARIQNIETACARTQDSRIV